MRTVLIHIPTFAFIFFLLQHLYINLDAYKDELYVHFDSDDEETGL